MDSLDGLLRHEAWTTEQLLELADSHGDEQFDRQFDIGHRTIWRRFEHIIWNVE
jgi:hypothetical protein